MEINAWIRKKRENEFINRSDYFTLEAEQASRKLDWLKDTVCTIHEGNLENEERRFYLENSFYIYIFRLYKLFFC